MRGIRGISKATEVRYGNMSRLLRHRRIPVLRSESVSAREFSPRAYSVFGPKLIATRGYFQDRALESRCLTEEMGGRALRADVPINLPSSYKEEARQLRNKLLLFCFRNAGRRVG